MNEDGLHRRAFTPRDGFCVVIAPTNTEMTLFYHQTALRLALEGYHVTGVGSFVDNAKISHEIADFGGRFEDGSSLGFKADEKMLTLLVSSRPLQGSSDESITHRVHIGGETSHSFSSHADCVLISYPSPIVHVVIPDILDQIVSLLTIPQYSGSISYTELPEQASGRYVVRRTVPATGLAIPEVEGRTDLPLEGVGVRLAPDGYGVFAVRSFVHGEIVMKTHGLMLNHQTEHSIQVSLTQHLEPWFPVRLINHSCAPNLGVRTDVRGLPNFHAFRNIAAGEELTFDYAMTELLHVPRSDAALEFSLKCYCGEESCRGQLGYYSTLPKEKKREYAGYISAYLEKSESKAELVTNENQ